MGATLYPANYKTTTAGVAPWLEPAIDMGTFIDPEYGRLPNHNPFEVHLTYGTMMTLLIYIGLEPEADTYDVYSGMYTVDEYITALYDAVEAYYADDVRPDGDNDVMFRNWLPALQRVALGAMKSGATHVAWS